MQIMKLAATNIGCLDSFEVALDGPLTILEGANGTGKSTVIRMALALLEGGKHADGLLQLGAKAGECTATLEDGTVIRRRYTAKGGASGTLSITRPNGDKVSSPAKWLKAMHRAVALNPVDFLLAKQKERVDMLLGAITVEATEADQATFGRAWQTVGEPFLPETLSGIEKLDAIKAIAAKTRSDHYALLKRAEETTAALKDVATSVSTEVDWSEEAAKARKHADDLTLVYEQELTEARDKHDQAKDLQLASIDDEIEELKQRKHTTMERSVTEWHSTMTAIKAKRAEEIEHFKQRATEAQEKSHQQAQAAGVVQQYEKALEERDTLDDERVALTKVMADIDALKVGMLKTLPIEGLEVVNGELFVDGIEWQYVNTAKQIEVAVYLTTQPVDDMRFVCLDGAERLDETTMQAMRQFAQEQELHLLATCVGDSEGLSVVSS